MTVAIHKKELDKLNKAIEGKTNIEAWYDGKQLPIDSQGFTGQVFVRCAPDGSVLSHECTDSRGQKLGTTFYGPVNWQETATGVVIEMYRYRDYGNPYEKCLVKLIIS